MKNILLFGINVFSIFLIFGCTKTVEKTLPLAPANNVPSQDPSAGSPKSQAVQSSPASSKAPSGPIDLSACLSACNNPYTYLDCKGACYRNKAIYDKNVEVCDGLNNPQKDVVSYTTCLTDYGVSIKSTEPCKRISTVMPDSLDKTIFDVCIFEVARQVKDPSMCSSIVGKISRDQCVELASKN